MEYEDETTLEALRIQGIIGNVSEIMPLREAWEVTAPRTLEATLFSTEVISIKVVFKGEFSKELERLLTELDPDERQEALNFMGRKVWNSVKEDIKNE